MSPVAAPVTLVASPFRRRLRLGAGTARSRHGFLASPRRLVGLVCITAWALLVGAELMGVSAHLHHDAVAEAGGDRSGATGLFLAGWVAMVVATMLPATASIVYRAPASSGSPALPVGAFIGGFVLPWTGAGVVLLSLDLALHRVVDAVPALEARPWLVAAGLLGAAGLAQLAPSTRRRLTTTWRTRALAQEPQQAFIDGARHGVRCLRADGPLMLVMFGAGAGLAWMAALTGVMAIERSSRVGRHAVVLAGSVLVGLAALTALHPAWLPATLAGSG